MKKLPACLIMLCVYVWMGNPAAAQPIKPSDINKILLATSEGGLGGGKEIDMELINEKGHWNSYQIMKDVFNSDAGGEPSMHSTERKRVTILTRQQVADFLSSIAVIEPKYTLKTFGFIPRILIGRLRNNVKVAASETPKLENIITEISLKEALAGIIKDEAGYDASMHCDIRIVKTNGDILKMETNHMYATMLPWKINGHDTYDMNINRFFIAAMGNIDYPNKSFLSIKTLEDFVYDTIDNKYEGKPIAAYRWNYTYADNVTLLKNSFTWTSKQQILGSAVCIYSFQSSAMPSNTYIEAMVDIADRAAIKHLIAYNNFITPYLKADNFVFKYYRNKPDCGIHIFYNWNNPENNEWEGLEKTMPYLKTVDPDKVLSFSAYAPDDNSTWLLLPDNKLVLTEHSPRHPIAKDFANALGLPADKDGPGIMPEIANTYYKIAFFNADGSVLDNLPH